MTSDNPISGQRKTRISLVIIIVAGLLQGLSFAPDPLPAWTLPFIQIISLAVLANYIWSADNNRQAVFYGLLFGFAQFGLGVYWLTISMHVYGGMAMPLAIGALLIFAVAMGLYGAIACVITYYLCRNNTVSAGWRRQFLNAIIWASSWTIFEWLRGTLFTGFTWLVGGYAHAEGMFTSWAPILGVYGLSWLAAFSAGAIALMVRAKDTKYDKHAALVFGMAMVFGLLGLAFKHINWSANTGEPILARLVQTNTDQLTKFANDQFWLNQNFAVELASTPAKENPPDLIILPETVVPIMQDQAPNELWQQWQDLADSTNAEIILGVPLRITSSDSTSITNSAISVSPGGQPFEHNHWHYDKQHLVPFGEFVPFGFRWFVDAMHIPLGDFNRGPVHQPPLQLLDNNFVMNICYEDTFGEEIAGSVAPSGDYPGANVLINISNLAWFGNSWALRQQLWMARLRAIETARPMLRATNTGITAVIDPNGIVRGALQTDSPGILDAEIVGAEGLTPYVKYGNLPILLISLLGLLFGWIRR